MEEGKKYTVEELTNMLLETLVITLEAHASIDKAYMQAKTDIMEAFNARMKSYAEKLSN